MTQKEIEKFLANTKVYVNGKSREIQEKLFSLGYKWNGGSTDVSHTEKPFLYIFERKAICNGDDMYYFIHGEYREITADEILSLELTEPTYRAFKNMAECWDEMLKHEPFGWVKKINGGYKQIMAIRMDIFNKHYADFAGQTGTACFELEYIYKNYTFADGAPFGIEERQ